MKGTAVVGSAIKVIIIVYIVLGLNK